MLSQKAATIAVDLIAIDTNVQGRGCTHHRLERRDFVTACPRTSTGDDEIQQSSTPVHCAAQ
jgi:hypothetical protein